MSIVVAHLPWLSVLYIKLQNVICLFHKLNGERACKQTPWTNHSMWTSLEAGNKIEHVPSVTGNWYQQKPVSEIWHIDQFPVPVVWYQQPRNWSACHGLWVYLENYHHFMAIIWDNLHYPSPPVKDWRIFFEQFLLPTCPCWQQLAYSD